MRMKVAAPREIPITATMMNKFDNPMTHIRVFALFSVDSPSKFEGIRDFDTAITTIAKEKNADAVWTTDAFLTPWLRPSKTKNWKKH